MLCTLRQCRGTEVPQQVSELMAYMVGILRASQEYKGAAWAAYVQSTVTRQQPTATRVGQRLTHHGI